MNRLRLIWIWLLFLPQMGLAESGMDHAHEVIGILPLPEVFGNGYCDKYIPQDITFYLNPSASHPIGKIYVAIPWTFPKVGGCEGLEVSVKFFDSKKKEQQLPTLEYSYEKIGTIVSKRKGSWFRISLGDRAAWVLIKDSERFLPVQTLLKEGLTYLSSQSQSQLVESPGSESTVWSRSPGLRDNLPLKVLGFADVSDQLWVKIRLMDVEPCSEEPTGTDAATGWVQFHDEDGMPSVWFYSRGC